MRYLATILVPDVGVADLLGNKDFSSERVHVQHEVCDEGLRLNIDAQDSVALRAVCNSITKLLTVYEKAEKI